MRGVRLRNQLWQNKTLGEKLVWKIYKDSNWNWDRILKVNYLDDMSLECILKVQNPPKGSRIWNFILNCRNLITNQITWNVKDGAQALFWLYSWGGYSTLDKLMGQNNLKVISESKWGIFVKDYMKLADGNSHGLEMEKI